MLALTVIGTSPFLRMAIWITSVDGTSPEELAAELGQDVDLVDLKEASTVLKMQIVMNGHLLFGESLEDDLFAASTMTQYVHLKESWARASQL